MKKKLKCILLVDDDNDCNYFHSLLLRDLQCVETINIAQDGQEALNFITTKIDGQFLCPDIIFLDINMPKMDGWQFLERYAKLDAEIKTKIVLIMLTTSLNPDDRNRAISYKEINGFNNKYLTAEMVLDVLSKHFADHLEIIDCPSVIDPSVNKGK
jgi:CheY-like chemotaxis protein